MRFSRYARAIPIAVVLVAAAIAGPVCTCQRPENVEAKKRLSKPAPPDPHVKAADDKIAVDKLDDAANMKRVVHMDSVEMAARLKSFSFNSNGDMTFSRGGVPGLKSAEKTKLVQADNGDFAVDTITGDLSEMKLAYVNEVFFLKNNNGKWRIDRDPQGERNNYRTDAMGVWKAFYDLIGHALVVEKIGEGKHDGREVMKYRLSMADKGTEAHSAGAKLAADPVGPDGGPADEVPAEHRKRMTDRMSQWRERAKPAGGDGELWVDMDAGVATLVKFAGKMVVGDTPDAAILDVKIDASITEVGKAHEVPMPKDAIEEVVRKKMPVQPREMLEEDGIVPPLADAGPAGVSKRKKPKPVDKAGELPDDDDDGADGDGANAPSGPAPTTTPTPPTTTPKTPPSKP